MKNGGIPDHLVEALEEHERKHLTRSIAGKPLPGSDVIDLLHVIGALRVDLTRNQRAGADARRQLEDLQRSK